MNVYDSELIEQILESKGYLSAQQPEEADIFIINTCAVRGHAEERAFSAVGELKRLKQSHPDKIIVFAGCIAQYYQEEIFKRFSQVDLVLGPDQIADLPDLLERIIDRRGKIVATARKKFSAALLGKGKKHSFVTIIRGCDNSCAYCIVPAVRGPAISRPKEEVLEEINRLVAGGTKEITLLGQNVNAYRQNGTDFSALLSLVDRVEGIEKITFVTNHPKDMSETIIDTIAGMQRFAGCLHLPVQSGSDIVLGKMNRGYTRQQYLQLVKDIRYQIPNCRITTDIIVGFPGETEADFQQTLGLLGEAKFDSAFTFKYSLRPGTPAAQLDDDVSLEVKKSRLNILNQKLKRL